MRFNLIGFGFQNYSTIPPGHWKHCVVHPGIRLISKLDEPGVLMCPQCGTTYLPKDTISEENFEPSASPKTQTRIIQPKKQKKYFDQSGNEINDEQLLKDIANGAHVISYHEQKSGKERHVVRKK